MDPATVVAEGDAGGGAAAEAQPKRHDTKDRTSTGRDKHGRSLRIRKESAVGGDGGNGDDSSPMLHSPPKPN